MAKLLWGLEEYLIDQPKLGADMAFSVLKFEGVEGSLHGTFSVLSDFLASSAVKGKTVQVSRAGIIVVSLIPNPEGTQFRLIVGRSVYHLRDNAPMAEPDQRQVSFVLEALLRESLDSESKEGQHNWFCYSYSME